MENGKFGTFSLNSPFGEVKIDALRARVNDVEPAEPVFVGNHHLFDHLSTTELQNPFKLSSFEVEPASDVVVRMRFFERQDLPFEIVLLFLRRHPTIGNFFPLGRSSRPLRGLGNTFGGGKLNGLTVVASGATLFADGINVESSISTFVDSDKFDASLFCLIP